ncbi:MAG: hypothetical protein PHC38_13265 [Weeksellaceae bacterium]|nr:hypothetical protein [Weeksellaceae bacterium]
MKNFIQKYLIETNIWVAFCFTALLAFFQLSLYKINFYVLGIAFFGTLSVYNFTRVKEIKQYWKIPENQKLQVFLTYFGLILTLIFLFLRGFELKTFLYLSVLGFISFCYSLPFESLGLRGIPFLKLFLIAFVWTGSSVGLLLIVHHEIVYYPNLLVSVFLFVAGICIPFDIRDSQTDESELKTIPQLIGLKKAKLLAIICLILSGLFFYFEFKTFSQIVLTWWISLVFSLFLVLKTTDKKSDFFYSFWVESASLFPLILFGIIHYGLA